MATVASDALMNPFDGASILPRWDYVHRSVLTRVLDNAVVKQRMQVHGSVFRSVAGCFRDVYRAEGISAFYISYPTTLTMTVPFTAVQFSTYEFLK